MQIVIDIPEGLKIDFENENWTALSCMEGNTSFKVSHVRKVEREVLIW